MQPSTTAKKEETSMRHRILKEYLTAVRNPTTTHLQHQRQPTTSFTPTTHNTTETKKLDDRGEKGGGDDASAVVVSPLDDLCRFSLNMRNKPIVNINRDDDDDEHLRGNFNGHFESGGNRVAAMVDDATPKSTPKDNGQILHHSQQPPRRGPQAVADSNINAAQPPSSVYRGGGNRSPQAAAGVLGSAASSGGGSKAWVQGNSWSLASSFTPVSTLLSRVAPGGHNILYSRETAAVQPASIPPPPHHHHHHDEASCSSITNNRDRAREQDQPIPVLYQYVPGGTDAFVSMSTNYTATTMSTTIIDVVETPTDGGGLVAGESVHVGGGSYQQQSHERQSVEGRHYDPHNRMLDNRRHQQPPRSNQPTCSDGGDTTKSCLTGHHPHNSNGQQHQSSVDGSGVTLSPGSGFSMFSYPPSTMTTTLTKPNNMAPSTLSEMKIEDSGEGVSSLSLPQVGLSLTSKTSGNRYTLQAEKTSLAMPVCHRPTTTTTTSITSPSKPNLTTTSVTAPTPESNILPQKQPRHSQEYTCEYDDDRTPSGDSGGWVLGGGDDDPLHLGHGGVCKLDV